MNAYLLKRMGHSIGAITAMRVAQITPDEMDTLTAAHPRVTQALCWDDLVSAAVQREWTLSVGQRTAYERIGHLIVELFFRPCAVGLADADGFDFPAMQADIADATGLTSARVNRTLKELRADGLLIIERRRVTLPDLDRLMQATMFDPDYLHLDRKGRHLDAND